MKNQAMLAVSRQAWTTLAKFKANSPHIMFGIGVVGVVGGAVLASRATLRAEKPLHEAQSRLADINEVEYQSGDEMERIKDRAVVLVDVSIDLVKLYGPALVVGGIGIASLTGSHVVLTKRNAGLMAAYAALERSYSAYRRQIREEFGEDREAKAHRYVENRIMEEDKELHQRKTNKSSIDPYKSSTYARFFDQTNPNWKSVPQYNLNFLHAIQNYHNDMLVSRGHVLLNDVYESLGYERTSAGAVVGWVYGGDGDGFIDFGVFDGRSNSARTFVNGDDPVVLLDFNVDGVIYNLIDWRSRR
jgi:hypothetical protein